MKEIKATINEQLQQLQMLMHRVSFNRFGKAFNPHRGQGRVLAILKLKPEISQKELTYLLNMSKQSVAELITKLEKRGYVTREPSEEDKRVMTIKLTEEGEKATDDTDDTAPEALEILDCLNDDELATLSGYLGRIIKQCEEQFPDEDFEQRRQMMEEFMSSFGGSFEHRHNRGGGNGRGFNGGRPFAPGMDCAPFMGGFHDGNDDE